MTTLMAVSATTVGGGFFVLTGVGQRTAGTACVVLALLREALPQAAGGVGDAGQEDEEDENGLHPK